MIPTDRAHLNTAALTDPGRSGKNNEDSYTVASFVMGPADPTPVLFAAVADGIGGHLGGEIASAMVVDLLASKLAADGGGNPIAFFQQAFYQVSEAIFTKAENMPALQGMGSTCSCVLIKGDRLYLAWVGDSRVYLIRREKIRQITRDHTWIQEAMDKGVLDAEMAARHPNRHVIRRYLGSLEPPAPDLRLQWQPGESDAQSIANQGLSLRRGDILVMCTDGLTDLVSEKEILSFLQTRNLQAAARNLVDLANTRGGHDNITVVLLAVPGEDHRPGWLGWLMGE